MYFHCNFPAHICSVAEGRSFLMRQNLMWHNQLEFIQCMKVMILEFQISRTKIKYVSYTVVPQPTLSLCPQKIQCRSKQLRSGYVFCSKCPGLFQNSIVAKNSATRGQCYVVNVLRYFDILPPVTLSFSLTGGKRKKQHNWGQQNSVTGGKKKKIA